MKGFSQVDVLLLRYKFVNFGVERYLSGGGGVGGPDDDQLSADEERKVRVLDCWRVV